MASILRGRGQPENLVKRERRRDSGELAFILLLEVFGAFLAEAQVAPRRTSTGENHHHLRDEVMVMVVTLHSRNIFGF